MRMIQRILWAIVVLTAISATHAQTVAGYEETQLEPDTAFPASATDSAPVFSQGVEFNRTWDFDCCPGGWAVSNQTDRDTAGFTNSFSAYAVSGAGAAGSDNYGIAFNNARGSSVITFSSPMTVDGMFVTNTTYAYKAVVDGDDGGGGFVRKFAANDWFRLEILGVDADDNTTGSVDFYLADYRNGQSQAVADWTWVDLTALGNQVERLEFELSSTDNGTFGMNTPSYFAIDNLTVIPEPGGMARWGAACALAFFRVRQRTRSR